MERFITRTLRQVGFGRCPPLVQYRGVQEISADEKDRHLRRSDGGANLFAPQRAWLDPRVVPEVELRRPLERLEVNLEAAQDSAISMAVNRDHPPSRSPVARWFLLLYHATLLGMYLLMSTNTPINKHAHDDLLINPVNFALTLSARGHAGQRWRRVSSGALRKDVWAR
jgi:hypothetical protein